MREHVNHVLPGLEFNRIKLAGETLHGNQSLGLAAGNRVKGNGNQGGPSVRERYDPSRAGGERQDDLGRRRPRDAICSRASTGSPASLCAARLARLMRPFGCTMIRGRRHSVQERLQGTKLLLRFGARGNISVAGSGTFDNMLDPPITPTDATSQIGDYNRGHAATTNEVA